MLHFVHAGMRCPTQQCGVGKESAGEVGAALVASQHCHGGERTAGLSTMREVNHLLQFLQLLGYNVKLEEIVWVQASSPPPRAGRKRVRLSSIAMTQGLSLFLSGSSGVLSGSEHSVLQTYGNSRLGSQTYSSCPPC